MKPSGLRPPTKIASKIAMPSSPRSNGLTELTESATNARGAMGPPPTGSIKHKPSGRRVAANPMPERPLTAAVPEPDAKRKTLRERAGEPYGSVLAAPPSSRPVNNVVKSIAANGSRGFSASTSRVPSNKTSRHISANSFGGSVGPGSRVPSANGYGARPKSAYGHSRSKSHHQGARPATSMAQHEEEDRPEPKGVQPFLISTNPKESRDTFKVPKNSSRAPKSRVYSLNVPPRRLPQLSTTRSISSPSSLLPTSPAPEEPADTDCDELLNGMGALTLGASTAKARYRGMGRGMTSGKDPDISLKSQAVSLIPRATPNRQMAPPPSIPRTPARAPTPKTIITPFLNRFTNDRCPVLYDDTRFADLEAKFTEFKEKIEVDISQQSNLKDTIKLYETRSTCALSDTVDAHNSVPPALSLYL